MKTDDEFGKRSCDEEFAVGRAVLRCNAVYHTSFADDPGLHYDPFWRLTWAPGGGGV